MIHAEFYGRSKAQKIKSDEEFRGTNQVEQETGVTRIVPGLGWLVAHHLVLHRGTRRVSTEKSVGRSGLGVISNLKFQISDKRIPREPVQGLLLRWRSVAEVIRGNFRQGVRGSPSDGRIRVREGSDQRGLAEVGSDLFSEDGEITGNDVATRVVGVAEGSDQVRISRRTEQAEGVDGPEGDAWTIGVFAENHELRDSAGGVCSKEPEGVEGTERVVRRPHTAEIHYWRRIPRSLGQDAQDDALALAPVRIVVTNPSQQGGDRVGTNSENGRTGFFVDVGPAASDVQPFGERTALVFGLGFGAEERDGGGSERDKGNQDQEELGAAWHEGLFPVSEWASTKMMGRRRGPELSSNWKSQISEGAKLTESPDFEVPVVEGLDGRGRMVEEGHRRVEGLKALRYAAGWSTEASCNRGDAEGVENDGEKNGPGEGEDSGSTRWFRSFRCQGRLFGGHDGKVVDLARRGQS
jgi:hypothetical protein